MRQQQQQRRSWQAPAQLLPRGVAAVADVEHMTVARRREASLPTEWLQCVIAGICYLLV
jgi:hypothetical protein